MVSIEPKDDMCRLQRPKVLSELAMCVNVPKIALMIHPGSTLSEVWCMMATSCTAWVTASSAYM